MAYYEEVSILSIHHYTIKYFPELANIDKNLSQSEVYKIIEEVVKKYYSEMVTDPILNNQPFVDIFDFEEKAYDSFYEIYENDTLVMDNLRKIYSENIPINEKIDKGFDYLKNILQSKICYYIRMLFRL